MSEKLKINTNEYLQQCNDKDVISFPHQNQKWLDISKVKKIIQESFHSAGIDSIISRIVKNSDLKNTNNIRLWFLQGEECEILQAGSKGWQKGKIRINISLEFIPDKLESTASPLDDVRQQLE